MNEEFLFKYLRKHNATYDLLFFPLSKLPLKIGLGVFDKAADKIVLYHLIHILYIPSFVSLL